MVIILRVAPLKLYAISRRFAGGITIGDAPACLTFKLMLQFFSFSRGVCHIVGCTSQVQTRVELTDKLDAKLPPNAAVYARSQVRLNPLR